MTTKVKMTKGGAVIHLQVERVIEKIGADISLARRARRMAVDDFARRIGVSRTTLHRLESGDPGISLNTFVMALHALGRLDALAQITDPIHDAVTLTQLMQEVPKRIAKRKVAKADSSSSSSGAKTKFVGF
ncbi:helix-turn-helix domain-containing protein [Rhizobium leguminosarum]|uniref:helix-turn-helix domain-containing protein n=1 Tax=Rhizobium leguminosarum TaxID=384 RepID=UPI00102FD3F1|nr:helix-turn-helix transcriptional regulator [Rhizobium leguminosarum]NEI66516.1 helix-turn-helix domain-containing protein [Rhizobium leguminosarum]TBF89150.1 XRE family transcriptional regulator [Rhizobium leguminosarum]